MFFFFGAEMSTKVSVSSLSHINSVHTRCIVKGEAQKSPLFWRFSGAFWFSQDCLFSRKSTRKSLNLIKSPIFTNTPCKSTCLYNAPSMHTVDHTYPFGWLPAYCNRDDFEWSFVVTFMPMPCTRMPFTWDAEEAFQPQTWRRPFWKRQGQNSRSVGTAVLLWPPNIQGKDTNKNPTKYGKIAENQRIINSSRPYFVHIFTLYHRVVLPCIIECFRGGGTEGGAILLHFCGSTNFFSVQQNVRQSSNQPPDWKSSWRDFCGSSGGVRADFSGRGPRLLRSCLGVEISTRNPSLEVCFGTPQTSKKSLQKRFRAEACRSTVLKWAVSTLKLAHPWRQPPEARFALYLVAQIARCNRDVRCDSNRTPPNR